MSDHEPGMLLSIEEQERVREGQRVVDLLPLAPLDPEPVSSVAVAVKRAA